MSATRTPVVHRLLKATFGKSEISHLIEQPRFRSALAKAVTTEDFKALRTISFELLKSVTLVDRSKPPQDGFSFPLGRWGPESPRP
jgi:hypothetical protein